LHVLPAAPQQQTPFQRMLAQLDPTVAATVQQQLGPQGMAEANGMSEEEVEEIRAVIYQQTQQALTAPAADGTSAMPADADDTDYDLGEAGTSAPSTGNKQEAAINALLLRSGFNPASSDMLTTAAREVLDPTISVINLDLAHPGELSVQSLPAQLQQLMVWLRQTGKPFRPFGATTPAIPLLSSLIIKNPQFFTQTNPADVMQGKPLQAGISGIMPLQISGSIVDVACMLRLSFSMVQGLRAEVVLSLPNNLTMMDLLGMINIHPPANINADFFAPLALVDPKLIFALSMPLQDTGTGTGIHLETEFKGAFDINGGFLKSCINGLAGANAAYLQLQQTAAAIRQKGIVLQPNFFRREFTLEFDLNLSSLLATALNLGAVKIEAEAKKIQQEAANAAQTNAVAGKLSGLSKALTAIKNKAVVTQAKAQDTFIGKWATKAPDNPQVGRARLKMAWPFQVGYIHPGSGIGFETLGLQADIQLDVTPGKDAGFTLSLRGSANIYTGRDTDGNPFPPLTGIVMGKIELVANPKNISQLLPQLGLSINAEGTWYNVLGLPGFNCSDLGMVVELSLDQEAVSGEPISGLGVMGSVQLGDQTVSFAGKATTLSQQFLAKLELNHLQLQDFAVNIPRQVLLGIQAAVHNTLSGGAWLLSIPKPAALQTFNSEISAAITALNAWAAAQPQEVMQMGITDVSFYICSQQRTTIGTENFPAGISASGTLHMFNYTAGMYWNVQIPISGMPAITTYGFINQPIRIGPVVLQKSAQEDEANKQLSAQQAAAILQQAQQQGATQEQIDAALAQTAKATVRGLIAAEPMQNTDGPAFYLSANLNSKLSMLLNGGAFLSGQLKLGPLVADAYFNAGASQGLDGHFIVKNILPVLVPSILAVPSFLTQVGSTISVDCVLPSPMMLLKAGVEVQQTGELPSMDASFKFTYTSGFDRLTADIINAIVKVLPQSAVGPLKSLDQTVHTALQKAGTNFNKAAQDLTAQANTQQQHCVDLNNTCTHHIGNFGQWFGACMQVPAVCTGYAGLKTLSSGMSVAGSATSGLAQASPTVAALVTQLISGVVPLRKVIIESTGSQLIAGNLGTVQLVFDIPLSGKQVAFHVDLDLSQYIRSVEEIAAELLQKLFPGQHIQLPS
jgi:hypothetical protein